MEAARLLAPLRRQAKTILSRYATRCELHMPLQAEKGKAYAMFDRAARQQVLHVLPLGCKE
jgi:hypothetical protein